VAVGGIALNAAGGKRKQHLTLCASYRGTNGRAVTARTQPCDVVFIPGLELARGDALEVKDAAEAGQLLITALIVSVRFFFARIGLTVPAIFPCELGHSQLLATSG
jgi:hypothetical protein